MMRLLLRIEENEVGLVVDLVYYMLVFADEDAVHLDG